MDILDSDEPYTYEPDEQDAACICSRCRNTIKEFENITRIWPEGEPGFLDTEYRYCPDCTEKVGLQFVKPVPEINVEIGEIDPFWNFISEEEC